MSYGLKLCCSFRTVCTDPSLSCWRVERGDGVLQPECDSVVAGGTEDRETRRLAERYSWLETDRRYTYESFGAGWCRVTRKGCAS